MQDETKSMRRTGIGLSIAIGLIAATFVVAFPAAAVSDCEPDTLARACVHAGWSEQLDSAWAEGTHETFPSTDIGTDGFLEVSGSTDDTCSTGAGPFVWCDTISDTYDNDNCWPVTARTENFGYEAQVSFGMGDCL